LQASIKLSFSTPAEKEGGVGGYFLINIKSRMQINDI
jgi:hypothetical protein